MIVFLMDEDDIKTIISSLLLSISSDSCLLAFNVGESLIPEYMVHFPGFMENMLNEGNLLLFRAP